MFDWKLLERILIRQPNHPDIPNLRTAMDDNLYFESLTRGGLVIGRPGVGKSIWLAMQVVAYALTYPDRPIFSLDASGSFTDEFIRICCQLPARQRNMLLRRIVYDRMGDPDFVIPLPFFSPGYDLDDEEQAQRVKQNYESRNEELMERTPIMSLCIRETLPELCRLLYAIQDEHGDSWQITEAKKLLIDPGMLKNACNKFGYKVPESKWYFERDFLGDHISDHERELRTYALRSILGEIEPRPIRARLGYHKPGWTPKEIIDNGLIYLASGETLINQEKAQELLFTDVFSHILSQINKRTPHNPDDKHVLLVIDEVPMLIRMKGMAHEIGKVPPQYRSRRLQLIVVIQALWQLADNLKEQIWSLGNVTCFGVDDFREAYSIAQQLFMYDPVKTRLPAASDQGQPILDTDRSEYLVGANWIQHLTQRECILRRYISEGEEDPFVGYVEKTSEKPNSPLDEPLIEIKKRHLKRRAIPVSDVLEVINQRKTIPLKKSGKEPPKVGKAA
jgi:hypothetical protein